MDIQIHGSETSDVPPKNPKKPTSIIFGIWLYWYFWILKKTWTFLAPLYPLGPMENWSGGIWCSGREAFEAEAPHLQRSYWYLSSPAPAQLWKKIGLRVQFFGLPKMVHILHCFQWKGRRHLKEHSLFKCLLQAIWWGQGNSASELRRQCILSLSPVSVMVQLGGEGILKDHVSLNAYCLPQVWQQ